MRKRPSISVHQINIATGDIQGNLENILACIKEDAINKVEISIFPETAFTGYMCGALWDNPEFISEQELCVQKVKDYLEELNHEGIVIVGFIEQEGTRANGYPRIYNSAAIIQAKRNIKTYKKRILASTDHHEDKKYFISGAAYKGSDNDIVFNVDLPYSGRVRIGIPICEDMWYKSHEWNLPAEMVEKYGADLIININQSYFHYGKMKERHDLLQEFSRKHQVPVIYCNSIGVGDIVKNIVIFDGGSMAFDNGNLLYQPQQFHESAFTVYDWNNQKYENLAEYSKYQEIWEALVFEQKEFFRLCGLKKAQVHISGGLDSAIVGALVVAAMGKENTVFITNPSDLNSNSLKYVHHLAKKLDKMVHVNPIQSIYDEFMKVDKDSFIDELSDTGKASVQAVLRTVQGLAASHRFGSGIVAAGNHTEIVLGWASFHDIGSIGVHAVIGDMTKMELFQFAKFINEEVFGKEVIPEDIYNGTFKPSAELPDAPGEDPIDYNIYSGICALLIRERKTPKDAPQIWKDMVNMSSMDILERPEYFHMLQDIFPDFKAVFHKYSMNEFAAHFQRAWDMMKKSVYKAAQGAPIVIISPRSRGFSNRETLINHYECS